MAYTSFIVGIPKEIKNNENRVSLTPAGAHELVQRGHTVYIQHTAGINSGFSDEEYEKVGARILPTIIIVTFKGFDCLKDNKMSEK